MVSKSYKGWKRQSSHPRILLTIALSFSQNNIYVSLIIQFILRFTFPQNSFNVLLLLSLESGENPHRYWNLIAL